MHIHIFIYNRTRCPIRTFSTFKIYVYTCVFSTRWHSIVSIYVLWDYIHTRRICQHVSHGYQYLLSFGFWIFWSQDKHRIMIHTVVHLGMLKKADPFFLMFGRGCRYILKVKTKRCKTVSQVMLLSSWKLRLNLTGFFFFRDMRQKPV